MAFELTTETAPSWLAEHGLNPRREHLVAVELEGGVSASVIAVTGPGVSVIVKQALPQLRVADRWEANVDRTETEAAALQLLGELTPGVVPRILAHDPHVHVVAMELLPAEARNWQAEIGEGRAHPELGRWAGETLGAWHAGTAERPELAGAVRPLRRLRGAPALPVPRDGDDAPSGARGGGRRARRRAALRAPLSGRRRLRAEEHARRA